MTGLAEAGSSNARRWIVVAALLTMYVTAYLDRQVISLLVEPIRAALAIDDFKISLVQGLAFTLFYALFGLIAGWLADHFPRRLILFTGIMVWSAGTLGCGLATSFWQLLAARLVVGAGEAALVPVAYATITGLFAREKAALPIAIFSLGSSVGSGLSLVGGAAIIAALAHGGASPPFGLQPWQWVFVCAALPGLPVAFLSFLLPRRSPGVDRGRETTPPQALAPFLSSRARYLVCNIGALSAAGVLAYSIGPWTPTMLMRTYGVSIAQAGVTVGICSAVGGVAGFLVGGSAADWSFRRGYGDGHMRPLFCAIPLAMALAIVGLLIAPGPLVSAACSGAMMGLASMGNPIATHVQLSTPAALRARLAAITVLAQMTLGMTLGPTYVALLTEYVFGDPAMLRYSMLVSMLTLGPLIMVLLWMGRAPARQAIVSPSAEQPPSLPQKPRPRPGFPQPVRD